MTQKHVGLRRRGLGPLLVLGLVIMMVLAACSGQEKQAEEISTIRIDYATYSPLSLVIKQKGWAEEVFGKKNIKVEWLLSLGSNRALEYLNGNSVDFGSTAGAASLIARSNGSPIKAIYVYSQPEWTALVTRPDTGIKAVADLKGRKVAATIGTDPFIFLVQALTEAGLSLEDVSLVPLQHGDGAKALEAGQVDAWAGLDPHMARVELESGFQLFYRNKDFNTWGVLNTRDEFAEKHPEHIRTVLELYERARAFALDNPEEVVKYLVDAAQIDAGVARLQLSERTDLTRPLIGEIQKKTFLAAGKVLLAGGQIKEGTDLEQVINDLVEPRFAQEAVQQSVVKN